MSRAALLLAVTLASTAFGCTLKTVDGPVTITTKPLQEVSKPELRAQAREVTGESCNRVVLLIIPAGFATIESAYAEALSKAPGTDVLLNYEERSSVLMVAPFYYQVCVEVHGYAISSKSIVAD